MFVVGVLISSSRVRGMKRKEREKEEEKKLEERCCVCGIDRKIKFLCENEREKKRKKRAPHDTVHFNRKKR